MPTPLRVHLLAKELGVPSKVIIEKCRAEGIELKNHMAAISLGLAESIREWFSVGADITSVEVAEPIDVERVRKKAPKRKKPEPAGETPTVAVSLAPLTLPAEGVEPVAAGAVEALPEAQPPAAPLAEPFAPPVEPVVPPVEPSTVQIAARAEPELVSAPFVTEKLVAQAPAAPVEAGPPAEAAAAQVEAGQTALEPAAEAIRPAVVVEPLPPSEPILPAGPKVVPKPAELKGPKIIRFEAPESTQYPGRRTAPFGVRGPLDRAPLAPGATTTTAARRGRGKGRKAEEEEAARLRSRSPRRHAGGASPTDVDQRLREWREQDVLERKERLASVTGHGLRDRRAAERRRQAAVQTPTAQVRKEPVAIITPVSVKEFCSAVGAPFTVVNSKLAEHTGRLWRINEPLDAEQAELIALDLNVPISIQKARTAYEKLEDEFTARERPNLQARPPVVAMLGHVDHGKTSLLDAIRKTEVAAGEAGGITQHIGAYRIDRGDWHVTFVDTPGHQAFTAMRARGANLTDVVVLVVAADDGVMPQTVEAINHAKAAGVPIVVALNKIDLPGIDLNRVYAQLSEQGLTPSEWGGQTDVIKTSATTGQGVDELIGHLSTLSDLLELQADPSVPAQALVIEAQMREGRGVVAQVLVREGTLRPGQCIVGGAGAGRIRALLDDSGKPVKAATPGTPVVVSGLAELPEAGDRLYQVESLSLAKEIAEEVRQRRREATLDTAPKPRTLEALLQAGAGTEVPALNIILKADVQGSVEVLKRSLGEFPVDKARLRILHAGVGAITEADVQLAKATAGGAIIIGFQVVPEDRGRQLAEQLGVEIRVYRVIYEILDDLHKALTGLLEPGHREEQRGTAEVRQVFKLTKVGVVAGCMVTDGVVQRNHKLRLVRDGRIVLEGAAIASLRRVKDDAREVRAGLECGIKLENFEDVKPGDVLQAYEVIEVAQEL